MKKIILLLTVAILIIGTGTLPVPAQNNFIVTNFNSSTDTSWTNQVIPKLNANYGNLIGWLNAHNSTNANEDLAISNLNAQVGTNISFLLSLRTNATYANGRNYTNLWGTNIVAGTLPANAFSAATTAWLESLPGASFSDIADGYGVVSLGGGLEINTNNFGVCGITNRQGDLSLVMTNDSNGGSILHLWNRNNCDGAAFENPTDGEVDFNFFGAVQGYADLFNIRYESRFNSQVLQANDPSYGGNGEFEYLAPNSSNPKLFMLGPNAAAFPTNVWFNSFDYIYYGNDNAGPQYPIDMAGSGYIGESDTGNNNFIQLDDGNGNTTITTAGQLNFAVTHGTAAIMNGSGASDVVLQLRSPNGTAYYLHVSNSGVLTATTSP